MSPTPIQRLASAAAAPLVLPGCRALHLELPTTAPVEHRELHAAVVADVVVQAAALPRGD